MSNFLCPHDEITVEVTKFVEEIQLQNGRMVETVKIIFFFTKLDM